MTDRVHFIVGMSRCGVTPLSRCLNVHPDVAVFGESRLFGRCYVAPESADGYTAEQLREILRVLRQFKWTATVGDAPGCLRNVSLERFRDLLDETFSRMEAPVQPGVLFTKLAESVADAEGKRYVFEKTPHHLNWIERIVEHVPSARFVVVLCDPYTFAGFHREKDALYHPLSSALQWRGYVRSYERAVKRYADRVVVVDAAALARDGTDALARVQRFFDLELHDLSAPLASFASAFAAASRRTDAADVFWINLLGGRLMRRHGYERRTALLGLRPLLRSLLSFPRWCVQARSEIKAASSGTPRYMLHWLRP